MNAFLKSSLLFFVTLILLYLGYASCQNANNYIQTSKEISQKNNTAKSVQKKVNELLEDLSLGMYNKYSTNHDQLSAMEHKALQLHEQSILYLYYFFATVIIFYIFFLLLDKEMLLIFIGLSAVVSLVTALYSPLLMMTVYKSFPLIGEVTLSYDSKSIFSTVSKLFQQSNYLVGLLVLGFSVIIPFFKSILIITYGFLKETGFATQMVQVIENIGKWSMADVFIVAVIVVFFSTQQDIHTSIKIETGLYFFIGYVLLSLLGSMLLTQHEVKKHQILSEKIDKI